MILRTSTILVTLVLLTACAPAATPAASPTEPPPTAVQTATSPPPTSTAPSPTETTAPTEIPPSPTPTVTDIPKPDATGKGVTVVILDRGIDWRHPDFLNPDGTTRIKWILDMSGQANYCSPDRPAPVEYTEAQINAALRGEFDLPHRDGVGHGTATAGLAAGNGSALPDARYAGVAPEADLIVIKIVSEAAPAVGDLPAQERVAGCFDEALDWVDLKIDELGQPAVAIWNAGTQWGPIDGTSAMSRKITQVFGPDRPGRIWVSPSGDEGSLPNHAGGDYAPGMAVEVPFELVTSGGSYPTAWYSGEAPAQVSIRLPDGTVVGPVSPGGSVNSNGVNILHYTPGNEFYPWTSTSGDYAVWIGITGHMGEGAFIIEATGANGGRFDLYGDILGPGQLSTSIEFLDMLAPGRLTDVAATIGAVVVGNHVERVTFVDIDGTQRNFDDQGLPGELWLKSSGGPTRDGRDAVDVTAAGQNAFAALGQDSYWSTLSGNIPGTGQGWYVRFGGASASAPIVVGTVALMLEVNPGLTAEQIKEILHATADTDDFTGPTPNPDWGYGKVNIFAAVEAAQAQAEAEGSSLIHAWSGMLVTAVAGMLLISRLTYREG